MGRTVQKTMGMKMGALHTINNNLNGLQLQSQAVAKVSHQERTFSIGDNSESDDEYSMPLAELRRKISNTIQRKCIKWKKKDLVSNL